MADKKKKQAGRRAYLNDFHRDLTGAYIYDGSHFHFAGDGWKELKAGKRNLDKVPDVADPWYTGNFDDTWRDVTAGCEGLLKFLD